MSFIPACPPGELMALVSVPITALIPNDPMPTLVVPVYPSAICPEQSNRIRLADYMPNPPGDYYVPVYSSMSSIMERFSRPLSALTHV